MREMKWRFYRMINQDDKFNKRQAERNAEFASEEMSEKREKHFCVNCKHHRRSWWRHVCVKPKWIGTDHNPITGKPFVVKHLKCSWLNDYAWCEGFEAKA